MPAVHPRVFVLQQARIELSEAVLRIEEKHELTACEVLCILNEMQARVLKSALRAERHPDSPDTPAGWE